VTATPITRRDGHVGLGHEAVRRPTHTNNEVERTSTSGSAALPLAAGWRSGRPIRHRRHVAVSLNWLGSSTVYGSRTRTSYDHDAPRSRRCDTRFATIDEHARTAIWDGIQDTSQPTDNFPQSSIYPLQIAAADNQSAMNPHHSNNTIESTITTMDSKSR
jgi:hypothetical protein